MKKFKLLAVSLTLAAAVTASAGTIWTQTLPGGNRLLPGDILRSQNGKYDLALQTDGWLVAWRAGQYGFWDSGTAGTSALMQYDANFVLYRGAEQANNAVWTINMGVKPHAAWQLDILWNGALQAYLPATREVAWQKLGDINNNGGTGTGTCPGGTAVNVYPACVNAGTLSQYMIPIPACSPGEAAAIARASGFKPGVC
ncbi:hypothetical protein GTP38_11285 [Duganella sp. FT94W]|uniref:Bulb-type lectin domain-containing protein n=1 Tax=Duganella lactea TaxID=2692173 RepID=A0ABW9V7J9_9BURK|nr:hypothetical protein [Duganella lactea]MYM34921.1 hypothetical protein [Duganella lactea]